MTAELLEIEVISGERVREIITECGGKVFVDEDLHSEAIVGKEKPITEDEEIIEEITQTEEEKKEDTKE